MDQCIFCSSRGDIKKCENTFCSYHDSWYTETLRAKLVASEQHLHALEGVLKKLVTKHMKHFGLDSAWDEELNKAQEVLETTRSEPETKTPKVKNVTIRTGTHLFQCTCGCRVFHKPDNNDANLYQCNCCDKQYYGEPEK
jgi:predicted SprT family Zn-dependent metalloprotease